MYPRSTVHKNIPTRNKYMNVMKNVVKHFLDKKYYLSLAYLLKGSKKNPFLTAIYILGLKNLECIIKYIK